MEVIKEFFDGAVKLISNPIYGDSRGCFKEMYHEEKLKECGIKDKFVQDNMSISNGFVFRGMHIQTINTQSKLLQCLKGEIVDYFLDLRRDSPTFGEFDEVDLTASKGDMIYIPKGFAHGFKTITPDYGETIVAYKCDDYYNPKGEISINPVDIIPQLDCSYIELSKKDKNGITVEEYKDRYEN
jgi:dTDP-4-dehydrorhamnose 3,5-epimerase